MPWRRPSVFLGSQFRSERERESEKRVFSFFFDCFFPPFVPSFAAKGIETSKSSPRPLFPHLDRLIALGPRRRRTHESSCSGSRAHGERSSVRSDGDAIRACRRGRERVALSRRRDYSRCSCRALGVDHACSRGLDVVPRSLERRRVGGRGGVLLSFVVVEGDRRGRAKRDWVSFSFSFARRLSMQFLTLLVVALRVLRGLEWACWPPELELCGVFQALQQSARTKDERNCHCLPCRGRVS